MICSKYKYLILHTFKSFSRNGNIGQEVRTKPFYDEYWNDKYQEIASQLECLLRLDTSKKAGEIYHGNLKTLFHICFSEIRSECKLYYCLFTEDFTRNYALLSPLWSQI